MSLAIFLSLFIGVTKLMLFQVLLEIEALIASFYLALILPEIQLNGFKKVMIRDFSYEF